MIEGEFLAAEKLYDASEIIDRNPAALQIRYLLTLCDIGVNQNSTVVFLIPMELLRAFGDAEQPFEASAGPGGKAG